MTSVLHSVRPAMPPYITERLCKTSPVLVLFLLPPTNRFYRIIFNALKHKDNNNSISLAKEIRSYCNIHEGVIINSPPFCVYSSYAPCVWSDAAIICYFLASCYPPPEHCRGIWGHCRLMLITLSG